MLARDEDEARELERQLAFRRSLGLRAERLRPSEAREREPALAPTVRLALEAPDDHSVDPRRVLAALRRACEIGRGAAARARAVRGSSSDGARRARGGGGRCAGGERIVPARAGGARGRRLERADRGPARRRARARCARSRVRSCACAIPPGRACCGGVVRFEGGYLVPRADGRYVLGATVEEQGFELTPTAGGVYELLRDAHELVPGVARAGDRGAVRRAAPGHARQPPAIGPGALEGLIWATGHYRNGILLAPLTAELVLAALTGRLPDPHLGACDRCCAPARQHVRGTLRRRGRRRAGGEGALT